MILKIGNEIGMKKSRNPWKPSTDPCLPKKSFLRIRICLYFLDLSLPYNYFEGYLQMSKFFKEVVII